LLQDVVALLAYTDTLHSPVAYLLETSQREFTADALNDAILAMHAGPNKSVLEKLLAQLTATMSTLKSEGQSYLGQFWPQ